MRDFNSRLADRARAFASTARFETALMLSAERAGVDADAARRPIAANDVRHSAGTACLVNRVKHEALYLACVALGGEQKRVARNARVSQPRVHQCIARIEADREDPTYDRKLDELELELMGAA